jgi:hypothetical protein
MSDVSNSGLRGGVRCGCGQVFEVIVREYREDSEMTNERKNITQPADWWVAFEEAAASEGMTLSAWVGLQCSKGLPRMVRNELTERPPANRPPKAKD